jgi:uncharacterized protein (DUF433 family)
MHQKLVGKQRRGMGRIEMNLDDYITIDPKVLVGKPVIKGTRLAVEFIVGLMAQGRSEDEIIRNYPGVNREQIHACLAYAQDCMSMEHLYAVTA